MDNNLTEAFDLIHTGLRMIRLQVESTEDAVLWAALGRAEVALLKPVRALRLRLGVPYDDELDNLNGG